MNKIALKENTLQMKGIDPSLKTIRDIICRLKLSKENNCKNA